MSTSTQQTVYSEFADSVAVVTGAASGIGAALAVQLAEHGANIVIPVFAGDPHDPSTVVAAVEAAGGHALTVTADVRRTEDVDAVFRAALDRWGRVDHVVAGAGVLRRQPLDTMTDDDWNDLLQVDLHGVMRTLRAGARHLGAGGSMVAVSSIAGGVYGWAAHSHYAACKAAVIGLVRSAAAELAPRGIRVNTIIPGLIETPQSMDAQNSLGPAGLDAAGERIPWGRVGQADEAAAVIRFLLSREARYVTGHELVVDGGLTIFMAD
ncbi:SDR family NAD(P)-dependent oxidoreductase [Curtobacterium sp. VKM Ac-2922]|uniref:SDR family NAD(P)-dependent oxidoreductase n=1 Tax=Curtobacterium sp. VKM Ac-2922 TaxID=2929475 RepID=UPI001FB4D15E|nr:SDR family NAD(P)-dependent oxidoreductase [Curtobacterium sp. VKM Ac-2922]MCJ1714388.1 SDR family oxidoreductase [Curtobacterium sp. VKM Ac-2922]